mmetsp:Transcript_13596/g.16515  ORF Transcript_13596/g.16515 Transcript_13596/m.16515 type:complete len:85 (-) Transcript_13596:1170-1424(-)
MTEFNSLTKVTDSRKSERVMPIKEMKNKGLLPLLSKYFPAYTMTISFKSPNPTRMRKRPTPSSTPASSKINTRKYWIASTPTSC